jgi:cell division transport system permease protein
MIGLGLFGLTAFVTLLINFERVAAQVGSSVGAVAFLNVDDAVAAEEIKTRIGLLPGVKGSRLVTPEEAMARVTQGMEAENPLVKGAAGLRMPWVVEISRDLTAGVAASDLFARISKMEGVDEVMHPGAEVERIEALARVLRGAGIFLTLLIAMVTVLVVSNTVKLTVLARSDEIAIMKLVGATDAFVRLPFIFEGLVQGLLGAIFALIMMVFLHASFAGILHVALSGAFGEFNLESLPMTAAIWIALGGAALGVFGAALSVRRFLRV